MCFCQPQIYWHFTFLCVQNSISYSDNAMLMVCLRLGRKTTSLGLGKDCVWAENTWFWPNKHSSNLVLMSSFHKCWNTVSSEAPSGWAVTSPQSLTRTDIKVIKAEILIWYIQQVQILTYSCFAKMKIPRFYAADWARGKHKIIELIGKSRQQISLLLHLLGCRFCLNAKISTDVTELRSLMPIFLYLCFISAFSSVSCTLREGLWARQLQQRNANKFTLERQIPSVTEIQWQCFLMGIEPYKNKLQILVKLWCRCLIS